MKKMFLIVLMGLCSVSFGSTDSSNLTDDEKRCIQECRLAKGDEFLAKMGCASKVGAAKNTCLYECNMELEKACYDSCVMPKLMPRHGKPLGIEE